ncbi:MULTISPECIES: GAF domain-containing protein [Sphingomonas]|uniref:GAF domain-containing protein n=1 Tax=Sphingomonas kyungheensis TaxID=1069987 RepID=A0ABU8H6J6_9SPHN|nr:MULTISPECIES: GAF domain-containing protein [unclassified Sphingomonas]
MSDRELAWKREAAVLQSGLLSVGHGSEIASIVSFVAARYEAPIAALSILFGGKQIVFSAVGIDVKETRRDDSFCNIAIQDPARATVALNALADDRFNNLAPVQGDPFIRFYAGAPIIDHRGNALGALCIADIKARDNFDPADLIERGREIANLIREW